MPVTYYWTNAAGYMNITPNTNISMQLGGWELPIARMALAMDRCHRHMGPPGEGGGGGGERVYPINLAVTDYNDRTTHV